MMLIMLVPNVKCACANISGANGMREVGVGLYVSDVECVYEGEPVHERDLPLGGKIELRRGEWD